MHRFQEAPHVLFLYSTIVVLVQPPSRLTNRAMRNNKLGGIRNDRCNEIASKPASPVPRRAPGDPGHKKGEKHISVVGGRINRKNVQSPSESQGGSVAASMSATARYRQSRRGAMKEPTGSKILSNPSTLHIPVSTCTAQRIPTSSENPTLPQETAENASTAWTSESKIMPFATGFIVVGGASAAAWSMYEPKTKERCG